MGACLRQYGITQMFKLFAKYIDCSKLRKFMYKLLHCIVPGTNNYPFDAIINIILPSSIHCKMLWQNYQWSNLRGLHFHKTMWLPGPPWYITVATVTQLAMDFNRPCSKVFLSSLELFFFSILVEQVLYRQVRIWVRNPREKVVQRKKQGVPIFPIGSPKFWYAQTDHNVTSWQRPVWGSTSWIREVWST